MKEETKYTGFSDENTSGLKYYIGKKLIKIRHRVFLESKNIVCAVDLVFQDSTYSLIERWLDIREIDKDVRKLYRQVLSKPYEETKIVNPLINSIVDKISVVTYCAKTRKKDGSSPITFIDNVGILFSFVDQNELAFQGYHNFLDGIDVFEGKNLIENFCNPYHIFDYIKDSHDIIVERITETFD